MGNKKGGGYKKWSKEERNKSYQLTKKAQDAGWIDREYCCQRCGQSEGIIHLHNEDYGVTLEILTKVFKRARVLITKYERARINGVLEELCWRCHMVHHSEHRAPKQCKEYWAAIADGHVFPPVYKHDFSILRREHGIR
jgi:hypothetical protein